jgi:hypothetical protein
MTQDTGDHRRLGDRGREPQGARRHNGQVAVARATPHPSSLAQCQYGVPVFVSSPSTPCWRGVGMIAARSVLCGAKHPP